jgi:signal transduction histidine kinase
MPFRPVAVDLVELVERILGECRQADDERHDIVFQCERRPVQAVVDPDICWNILTNLLRNACNYSIAGSQIVVSLKREPGAFALSVADRGIGIPEADQRRLFSSFERGSNVGSIKGTGLGLCIVKRLVEVHGGVVSFESRLDYGTSFTVMLPELPLGALPSPDHAIAAEDSHH